MVIPCLFDILLPFVAGSLRVGVSSSFVWLSASLLLCYSARLLVSVSACLLGSRA